MLPPYRFPLLELQHDRTERHRRYATPPVVGHATAAVASRRPFLPVYSYSIIFKIVNNSFLR
jgi:hypothetical protein